MILLVFGTRPEFIKVKPLMDEMLNQGIPLKTLFTGQHKDMVAFETDYSFEIRDSDSTNRLNQIISECLDSDQKWAKDVTHVLIQGDTSSALGIALSAFNNRIKVIHLEAGLRTYDVNHPYPEETNRQLISRLADLNLCPTKQNEENLISERVIGKTFVVGNTGLDSIREYKGKCNYAKKVLVTLHRRENHDSIPMWFEAVEELANEFTDYEFVIPIHPNPNVRAHSGIFNRTKVVNPMSHEELLDFLSQCSMVITDSGGIQEECSFMNKKCLVCRTTTERPEAISMTTFLISEPSKLFDEFKTQIQNPETNFECPFGDGYASEKICEILKKEL